MWEAILSALKRCLAPNNSSSASRQGTAMHTATLLPHIEDGVKQEIQAGSGNVQVGIAHGDVSVTRHSQAVYHIYMVDYSTQQNSPQAQPPQSSATREQLPAEGWQDVLAMIRNLPNREEESVFRFMERKFNTRMVRSLKASELQEVRWYTAKIAWNLNRKPRQASVRSSQWRSNQ